MSVLEKQANRSAKLRLGDVYLKVFTEEDKARRDSLKHFMLWQYREGSGVKR
jgi:hypothetical protein